MRAGASLGISAAGGGGEGEQMWRKAFVSALAAVAWVLGAGAGLAQTCDDVAPCDDGNPCTLDVCDKGACRVAAPGGACLHIVHLDTPKPFVEAIDVCQDFGGYAASIHSAEENEAVRLLVREVCGHERAALGLQDTQPPGQWMWLDGTVADFFQWAPGEPTHTAGGVPETWVELRTDGAWNDVAEDVPMSCVVCAVGGMQGLAGSCSSVDVGATLCDEDDDACTGETCDPADGSCHGGPPLLDCDDGDECSLDTCSDSTCHHEPACVDGDDCTLDGCYPGLGDCTFSPHDASLCDDGDPCTADACTVTPDCDAMRAGKCYRLVDAGSPVDYDTARDTCAAMGGMLVEIGSADENALVASLVGTLCAHDDAAFIGLSDAQEEGWWRWQDGTRPTYVHWRPGEPNDAGAGEDYAEIYADGGWNDTSLAQACAVCEVPLHSGCVHTPLDCDDGNPCTTDDCFDGTMCTHEEGNTCLEVHGCVHGVDDSLCNDDHPCTVDRCLDGACVHVAACPGGDLGCVAGACDPQRASCGLAPVEGACDDGDPCTLDACPFSCDGVRGNTCYRVVQGGTCVGHGMNPVMISSDDENALVATLAAEKCPDGQAQIGLVMDEAPASDWGIPDRLWHWVTGETVAFSRMPNGDFIGAWYSACPADTKQCWTVVDSAGEWHAKPEPTDCRVCEAPLEPAACEHTPVDCDDGFLCTADACDPTQGCVHVPDDALCDDGVACTVDTCAVDAGCVHTPAPDTAALCDDGDACTADVCAKLPDAVGPCDDEFAGSCYRVLTYGAPGINWDQAADACDALGMDLVAIGSQEENDRLAGLVQALCNGEPGITGLMLSFDETSWLWINGEPVVYTNWAPGEPNNAGGQEYVGALMPSGEWNDTTYFFIRCVLCEGPGGWGCQHAPACEDGIACTEDVCEAATGACTFVPDDGACDDGVDCSVDTCDPVWGCVHLPGDASACDDGDPCTVDYCGAALADAGCDAVLGHACYAAFDDGTIVHRWYALDACEAWGGHLATIGSQEENDVVAGVVSQGCSKGRGLIGLTDFGHEGVWKWDTGEPFAYANWAPGEPNAQTPKDDFVEMYDWGGWNDMDGYTQCYVCERYVGEGLACRHEPIDCDDGVPCTLDACDPATGACSHLPDDAACDDGVDCTVDACDPAQGCTAAPDDGACDDGIACTDDACGLATGCTHAGDDAACADGSPCTADHCDAAQGCVYAPVPPGDLTGDGTRDVVDVQCHVLVVLATGAAEPLPACMAAPPSDADLDCNGAVNVTDTVVLDYVVLGLGLSETVDGDGDGCPDACTAKP